MKIHPSKEVLWSLSSSPGEAEPRLLRHLVGCARCRSRLEELSALPVPARVIAFRLAVSDSYDQIFERSQGFVTGWVRLLQRERDEAPGLLRELLGRTPGQREMLLRNSRRFQTWGLLELLVEQSLETGVQDPRRGEELGRLALRVADLMDSRRYSAGQLQDLRARAWSHIGNALRIQSALPAAEIAFEQGLRHLELGTGNPLELAIFLDLQASLRRSQRRFAEALRLLKRAIGLFSKLGDPHRAGRSLINLSLALLYSGRAEESVPALRQAMKLIEPEREPRLLLSAWHNLIAVLTDLGHFLEAQRAYREALPLYRTFPDAWTRNRRVWLKGKIARGLGQVEEAEALFLAAREGFLAEGIPYETALVALDLALIYAEQGRTTELKRLAADLVPVFASRRIHREALAALSFFQRAVEAERAEVEVVARVEEYLRKSRYAPDLPFQEAL